MYRPIFQAYVRGYHHQKYGQTYDTVPPFQDPEISIDVCLYSQVFMGNYGSIPSNQSYFVFFCFLGWTPTNPS